MALQCFALELDVTTTDVADTSFDTSRSEKKVRYVLKIKDAKHTMYIEILIAKTQAISNSCKNHSYAGN